MGGYYNDELRHRQLQGDVGHAVLGDFRRGGSGRRWRALLFPVAVLAIGVLLLFVGPLPGLGMVLCIGGVFALPMVALRALLGP
ncbi:MAG: hypothetical protein MUF35_06655 [Candidatus Nanopelagicales bacterium]|jgi:hypothetical protein|nr:hypothetical protein [Candidatus Nanopelagicales bacterium]